MKTPAKLRLPTILLLTILTITAVNGSRIDGTKTWKLDEIDENKCGGCPCSNPCTPISYPPPPPSPPPPPPPVKPPPFPGNCPPPPPPSSDIIIMGPPGSLYPIGQSYNNAGGRSFVVSLPDKVAIGLVAILMMG